MKPIRLSGHAKDQIIFRGTTEEEVIEAMKTSKGQSAELNRLECKKDFPYDKEWNKVYYKTKQVMPIFIDEEEEIIVITVYTYFFK